MKPRIWPILLASGIGLAILLTLGVWQVQRLAWKTALIKDLNELAVAAPVPIDASHLNIDFGPPAKPVREFQRVSATGHFSQPIAFRMIATANGSPGWRVIQSFSVDGVDVLVDRGVALGDKVAETPTGEMTLTGVVRFHNGGKGYFDPDNDVAGNRWYWWDMTALRHLAPRGELSTLRYVLQLEPGSAGTEGLVVAATKAELRNNHLGYAITWFGLAAVLVVMTGVFLYQNRHSKRVRNEVE